VKTVRRATKKDFSDHREFCSVHIQVGTSGLFISQRKGIFVNETKIFSEFRLGDYGTIDKIELGATQRHSVSPGRFTGYLIDYVENADAALAQAKLDAEAMRDKFIEDYMGQIETLKNLTVVVAGESQVVSA
jgi:hypothetical protein